jgi:hypothetical protein
MGASCSIETANSASASASAKDLKRKMVEKMESYKVSSSKVVKTAQEIIIEETGPGVSSSPVYQGRKTDFNFLGIKTGDCPEYGCAYSVNQNARIELYTINSTIINESENIWNDVSNKAELKLKAEAGSETTASGVLSESKDEAIMEINKVLESMVSDTFSDEQSAVIRYTTPILCEGPCNNQRGPVLNQQAYFTIKADNIINSVSEVIEKNKRKNNVKSKTNAKAAGKIDCLFTLGIIGCICAIIVFAMWKFASTGQKQAAAEWQAAQQAAQSN